jgi:hypothetical protein
VYENGTFGNGPETEDAFEQLGPTGSHQSADSQDFTCANLEGNILESGTVHRTEIIDLEDRLTDHLVLGRKPVAQFAIHHELYELVRIDILCVLRSNPLPIPEDGDPVRDIHDFFDLVGDIDDAATFLLQLPYDLEQTHRFLLRQGRGRLVKNDDFRIIGNRFHDIGHLLGGYRQMVDLCPRINVHIEELDDLKRVLVHLLVIDQQTLAGISSQPDVINDITVRNLF